MNNHELNSLIAAYENDTIGKQQLGTLRRLLLTDLLDSIKSDPKLAKSFLSNNGNKLDRKKLANAVGYGLKTVNISQSFKDLVDETESSLKANDIISTKTDETIRQESVEDFKTWLNERIADHDFQWPVNNKNAVYRRVLWAFYLNADPSEITKAGSIMNDSDIRNALAEMDVRIVRGEVETADYAAASALEEMSDTMQSKAIGKLSAEVKELKEKLANANEEIRNLKLDLKVYETRDQSLLKGNIKGGSIH